MSDLHCRLETDAYDSFLVVGQPRVPPEHHPVEALKELIDGHRLRADLLLVPGDIANKASREGLDAGWRCSREVAQALHCGTVIPVLGNHDVDSRGKHKEEATKLARTIERKFPYTSPEKNCEFFGNGCCLLPIGRDMEIAIVNSVIDHFDAQAAERGTFDESRIASLRILLQRRTARFRIAMLHHHLLPNAPYTADKDVLPTGHLVLRTLREGNCGFVVHGHKHFPHLYTTDTNSGPIVVFGAGSFSANLLELGSVTRNLFHIVELEPMAASSMLVRGEITTWEWGHGEGWVEATIRSAHFPFRTGFGNVESTADVAHSLNALASSSSSTYVFESSQIAAVAPQLRYMMPSEFNSLNVLLNERDLVLRSIDNGDYELGRKYKKGIT
jgi:predicted phosphodiesterase